MSHRQIKQTVADLLRAPDFEESLTQFCKLPPKQAVNPLFGLLYAGDPIIRWRAVSAMGAVVSILADEAIESARIIMRRFMWNLNDESGGIGWGSPEAMAEIMARHGRLAHEYAAILVSYADPKGNYLEHPGLQIGVLWALGRLGRVYPQLLQSAAALLPPFLASPASDHRGLALWAAAALPETSLQSKIEPSLNDSQTVIIYHEGRMEQHIVGQLAEKALQSCLALKY